MIKHIVYERWVHGNIAVIANKDIASPRPQIFKTRMRERRRRLLDHLVHVCRDHVLDFTDAIDAAQLLF